MLVTSAEANKKLKQLYEQEDKLLTNMRKASVFSVASGENAEELRPEFNYILYINEHKKLAEEIRNIKHSINEFNVRTVIPELNMTIDQALVYIPFLTNLKKDASEMMARLPKERKQDRYNSSPIIDYTVANYDIKEAEKTFEWVSEELSKAQLALDAINNTIQFDI